MAMKYYSERTKKLFDTAAECEKAEFEAKEEENRQKIKREREIAAEKARKEELAAKRKVLANEVEEARKAMVTAPKAYRDKLEEFCKEFGTYHTSLSTSDIPTLFNSLFDWF